MLWCTRPRHRWRIGGALLAHRRLHGRGRGGHRLQSGLGVEMLRRIDQPKGEGWDGGVMGVTRVGVVVNVIGIVAGLVGPLHSG